MTGRFWQSVRKGVAAGLCAACPVSFGWAQQASIAPVRPSAPVLWRPYLATDVPPTRLANSPRLRELIRAGTLYLTAQDAIALALENNIDIEVSRYHPFATAWRLERAQAGGALPGVPSGASQAGTVASGQGVVGSQTAAGVTAGPARATGAGAGNATISQVGPVTQTLDPAVQQTTTFSHTSTPQQNVVQSGTPVLISNTRAYTASIQEGFLSGGGVSLNFSEHYLNENAPTDVLNPSVAPNLSVSFQHNLLRGFGVAVNSRTITVARINMNTSELNFKTQVIGTVTNVLNLYYGLVADYDDVRAKKSAVEAAKSLYDDNQKQERVGTLTPLDVTTAGAQVASAERDLVISETTLEQQELQLKNLLSRTGVADPLLTNTRIVPLDRIVMPAKDDLPPVPELIKTALANRSDLAAAKANVRTAEVSAMGTHNGVLPSLQVFGIESAAGLSGRPRTVISRTGEVETPDPYFAGGIGNALGQVFRRNFPSNRLGTFFQAPIHNRQAQADFGIDQLQLRQTELTTQKQFNQLGVDVMNSVIALRQARVKYDAALHNRILEQQLVDAEQKKYALGASTPYNIIQQQRDLAAGQAAEISALASYSSAKIALDQTLGTTLETNHISIGEAQAGRVSRPSSLPATLPKQP
jgi:outer membrane protein TolC